MSTPLITIFVRHSPGCKYAGDEFCKRCRCPKHYRWSMNGKQYRRASGCRSWEDADDKKRELMDQLAGRGAVAEPSAAQTIQEAMDIFIQSREIKKINAGTVQRYKLVLGRFVSFCEGRRVFTFAGVTAPLIIQYRATWEAAYPSTYTQEFVRKRLRVFLNFCKESAYLERVPKMDPVKIEEPPTMPLTKEEYAAVLNAVHGEFSNGTAEKIYAVILLMRWSGLAVRDAVTIRRDAFHEGEGAYLVNTSRQKTGVSVSVPVPASVAREILKAGNGGEHLFWNPSECQPIHAAAKMSQHISRVFTRAKVYSEGQMISHRLRDTFAVDLLEKGVALEDVSKLLGHESIITTEKHYAKWVKGRQDRLTKIVTATWEASC